MKKKRKKKKLLLYNLGNKIKAPSCVRASGPLAESRRQAFGPYCWIRGRTQPVYIYIYTLAGRQTRVATFYTAKGRQSGIGPRFFLSGSSKRQRRNPPLSGDCAMPACLPVILWLTTAGQRLFLRLDERKRTFTNLATRKWPVIEENGTTWI